MVDRRRFLTAIGAGLLAPGVVGCNRSNRKGIADRRPATSRVAILPAAAYDGSLADVVLRGLRLLGVTVPGKTVVLKPNLVEYSPDRAITTHPSVVAAAIEAFRRLGADAVVVAEGPGHRRDTEYLTTTSGLAEVIGQAGVPYVDINLDDARPLPIRGGFTRFPQLYFPDTVLKADLLVSMPKLKTHHWAGVTLSMKNMFGIMPSAVYGWPKNALHWAGIHESILDINSTLPVPRLAIVDGIVGMEGNGPIYGTPKRGGVLLFGSDLVAVDATAARLMSIEPEKVRYLAKADEFLGNVRLERITQIGEPLERHRTEFRLIERLASLRA